MYGLVMQAYSVLNPRQPQLRAPYLKVQYLKGTLRPKEIPKKMHIVVHIEFWDCLLHSNS